MSRTVTKSTGQRHPAWATVEGARAQATQLLGPRLSFLLRPAWEGYSKAAEARGNGQELRPRPRQLKKVIIAAQEFLATLESSGPIGTSEACFWASVEAF